MKFIQQHARTVLCGLARMLCLVAGLTLSVNAADSGKGGKQVKNRKIMATALILCFVLALIPFASSAATGAPTISLSGPVSVKPGATVTFAASIDNNAGLSSSDMVTLTYIVRNGSGEDVTENFKPPKTGAFGSWVNASNSAIWIYPAEDYFSVAATSDNFTDNGELLTFDLTPAEDLPAGDYSIALAYDSHNVSDSRDLKFNPYTFNVPRTDINIFTVSGSNTVIRGEPAEFTVSIAENTGFASFAFDYTVLDSSNKDVTASFTHTGNDWVKQTGNFGGTITTNASIEWHASSSAFTANGDLFTFTLTAADDLPEGNYSICLKLYQNNLDNFKDSDGNPVDVNFASFTFQITQPTRVISLSGPASVRPGATAEFSAYIANNSEPGVSSFKLAYTVLDSNNNDVTESFELTGAEASDTLSGSVNSYGFFSWLVPSDGVQFTNNGLMFTFSLATAKNLPEGNYSICLKLYGDQEDNFAGNMFRAIDVTFTPYTFKVDVERQLGDVNGDGKVDSTDATLALQYGKGIVTDSQIDVTAADVNKDGAVDRDDAQLILKYCLGAVDAQFQDVA